MLRLVVLAALSLAALSLIVAGCGSGESGLVSVGGIVVLDDKPVAKAAVMFHHSGGRTAYAVTNDDGTFQLTTRYPGDGAPTGDYNVTVWLTQQEGGVQQNANGVEDYTRPILPEKTIAIVPTIYNDPKTSPIVVTVDKPMKFKIPLESSRR